MAPPTKADLAKVVGALLDLQGDLNRILTTVDGMITSYDQPVPNAPQPLKIGAHRYLTTGAWQAEASVFDVQRYPDLVRVLGTSNEVPNRATDEVYLYATTCKSANVVQGDPNGYRQLLPPSQVPDTWLLRNPQGRWISRPQHGTEYLIDIGRADFAAKAAAYMVDECKKYGANGVYLDEVDQNPWWGYPTTAQGMDVAKWQAGMWSLVETLAKALHASNLKLWINLGADYDVNNRWQAQLLALVDRVNIEHFVGRQAVGAVPTRVADGDQSWLNQGQFVIDAEYNVQVDVHVSTTDQAVVDYGFMSWLMFTSLRGSWSASLGYNGSVMLPSSPLLNLARRLGQPVAPMGTVSSGYVRRFQYGEVYVNPFTNPRGDLGPMTGKIVVQ